MEENNTKNDEGPILTYLHGMTGTEDVDPKKDNDSKKAKKKKSVPAAPAAAAAASAETEPEEKKKEPVRYVNVPLTLDMHRRLNAIKYDLPGERLATLGAQAIEEFVARMEAKKKREGLK